MRMLCDALFNFSLSIDVCIMSYVSEHFDAI